MRRDMLDARTRFRIHDVNGDRAGHGDDLRDARADLLGEIGLREDNDRGGAAFVREQQQIPLEAPHAEVGVEPHDDEYDVDVGGDHLFIGHRPSHPARERAAPRQHRDNRAPFLIRLAAYGNPVTDSRQLAPARRDASTGPRQWPPGHRRPSRRDKDS